MSNNLLILREHKLLVLDNTLKRFGDGPPCCPSTNYSCCLPNGTCLENIQPYQCSQMFGVSRPTSCETPCATGACCIPPNTTLPWNDEYLENSTCRQLMENPCLLVGGTWSGNLNCSTDTDLCLNGACCTWIQNVGYNCSNNIRKIDCLLGNGVFRGVNSLCSSSPCPTVCPSCGPNLQKTPAAIKFIISQQYHGCYFKQCQDSTNQTYFRSRWWGMSVNNYYDLPGPAYWPKVSIEGTFLVFIQNNPCMWVKNFTTTVLHVPFHPSYTSPCNRIDIQQGVSHINPELVYSSFSYATNFVFTWDLCDSYTNVVPPPSINDPDKCLKPIERVYINEVPKCRTNDPVEYRSMLRIRAEPIAPGASFFSSKEEKVTVLTTEQEGCSNCRRKRKE